MNGEVKKLHLKDCTYKGQKAKLFIEKDEAFILQNISNGAEPKNKSWKQYGFKYSYFFILDNLEDLKNSDIIITEINKKSNYELWEY